MRWVTISILVIVLSVSGAQAQTPTPPAPPKAAPTPPTPAQAAPTPPAAPARAVLNPTKLGTDFVDLLNTLDDWRISMDGKEVGVDKVVDGFMAVFAPDVLSELPPDDEEQIGPLELVGSAQLRKWVEKFVRSHVEFGFLIGRQTQNAVEGELMVYSKPLPWGGLGIAFQVIAPYSMRVNRDKFLEVGSVFLQYGDDEKIHRFRLYLSEKSPVRN